jgi:hypothetical protein
MTWLEAVEVADVEPVEAAELFAQAPKLQKLRPDMETEVALIVKELGYLALAITLAVSYIGGHFVVVVGHPTIILPNTERQRRKVAGSQNS